MNNTSSTINSTFLFAIAFIAVYLIHEFTLLISASIGDLHPVMYHNTTVLTGLSEEHELWYFISGPLAALTAGIISLFFAFRIKNRPNLLIFLTWLYVAGAGMFLAQVLLAPLFDRTDMGKVFIAAGFGYNLVWIFAVVALVASVFSGRLAGGLFLRLDDISHEDKNRFLLQTAVIPWMWGTLLTLAFRVPPFDLQAIFLPFFTGILILWSFLHPGSRKKKITKKIEKPMPAVFAIYIVLIILVHTLLRTGISF